MAIWQLMRLLNHQIAAKTGDYIGMKFNKPIAIQTLTFAMGTQANPHGTFSKAEVQYQMKTITG